MHANHCRWGVRAQQLNLAASHHFELWNLLWKQWTSQKSKENCQRFYCGWYDWGVAWSVESLRDTAMVDLQHRSHIVSMKFNRHRGILLNRHVYVGLRLGFWFCYHSSSFFAVKFFSFGNVQLRSRSHLQEQGHHMPILVRDVLLQPCLFVQNLGNRSKLSM